MTSQKQAPEKFELGNYRFHRDVKGQLVPVPSGPELEGYLAFDLENQNFVQVRLLKTSDILKRNTYKTVWKRIGEKNDCTICPEILAYGEEDSGPYFVCSLPSGEPVSCFVKRTGPVPPEVAAKIVAKFIRSIKAQNPVAYEEFEMRPEVLWVALSPSEPRVIFGDFSPLPHPNAEAINAHLCLDLLRYLSGNPPYNESFQEMVTAIDNGPQTLEYAVGKMEQFLERNPATEYWTDFNQPTPLLHQLVPPEVAFQSMNGDSTMEKSPYDRPLWQHLLGVAAAAAAFGLLAVVGVFSIALNKPDPSIETASMLPAKSTINKIKEEISSQEVDIEVPGGKIPYPPEKAKKVVVVETPSEKFANENSEEINDPDSLKYVDKSIKLPTLPALPQPSDPAASKPLEPNKQSPTEKALLATQQVKSVTENLKTNPLDIAPKAVGTTAPDVPTKMIVEAVPPKIVVETSSALPKVAEVVPPKIVTESPSVLPMVAEVVPPKIVAETPSALPKVVEVVTPKIVVETPLTLPKVVEAVPPKIVAETPIAFPKIADTTPAPVDTTIAVLSNQEKLMMQMENDAKLARLDKQFIQAIDRDVKVLKLTPKSIEAKMRLNDDLLQLQKTPDRAYTQTEIEILKAAASYNVKSHDILVKHYRNTGNWNYEIASLISYGKSGRPDKLTEAGERIFQNPTATVEDLKAARQLFAEAATAGDAAAQFFIGECLILGRGGNINYTQGAYYLRKAINQGDARAMDLLGVCYVRGWGVPRDDAKAVELFQAAIDKGNIPACYNLGARYAQGQGVERSGAKAADLFEIGSLKGNANCMLVFARCFEAGYGREQDTEKAKYWFSKAAEKGNAEAIEWCKKNEVDYLKQLVLELTL